MELIQEIMRNLEDFSSVVISGFNELIQLSYELMIPIDTDPPLHGEVRGLMREHVQPSNVARLADGVRKLAREVVQKCVVQGSSEFVKDVASIYPMQIFLLPMEGRRPPSRRC